VPCCCVGSTSVLLSPQDWLSSAATALGVGIRRRRNGSSRRALVPMEMVKIGGGVLGACAYVHLPLRCLAVGPLMYYRRAHL
jgi:hypothetical protein